VGQRAVPSHRAIPLLISDPRLQALLPASGSPLWWNLLLGPAAAAKPVPLEWLRDGLTLPLLDRLLAGGWVPPLPREQLAPALKRWPLQLRGLLLPPPAVLARCTNLEPLTAMERQRRQQLWDRAAPESP
jgi:putative spermidine/putrescine transport system substrate-binding protein